MELVKKCKDFFGSHPEVPRSSWGLWHHTTNSEPIPVACRQAHSSTDKRPSWFLGTFGLTADRQDTSGWRYKRLEVEVYCTNKKCNKRFMTSWCISSYFFSFSYSHERGAVLITPNIRTPPPFCSSFGISFTSRMRKSRRARSCSTSMAEFSGVPSSSLAVAVSENDFVPSEVGRFNGAKDDNPSELGMPKFQTNSCWCLGADDDCRNLPGCTWRDAAHMFQFSSACCSSC